MSVDVGTRLRFVRERQNLSQRELARLTGVTNSTISLIEANRMNPSIGALKRILDGIPIGLAEFFAIEPDAPSRFFYGVDELTEIGKGAISYRQVGESLFGRSLQILSETYAPGADTGRVPLMHDGEEGAVIISGRSPSTGSAGSWGPATPTISKATNRIAFAASGPNPATWSAPAPRPASDRAARSRLYRSLQA